MTDIPIICTWYWRQEGGRTKYQPWHIAVWADMVRRNITRPHRIACITHEDIRIDGVELIRPPREFDLVRIPTWKEARPQCLRRLVMFAPGAAEWLGEWIVCMDADAVITGPLDPLLTDHDFRMFRGTSPGRPYNGSMFMLRAGSRPQVYTDFTPEGAAEAGRRYVGSDQAWITHCLGPNEATWGPEDGVAWHGGKASTDPRVLFFPGNAKPWDLPELPAVAQHYRRDPQPGYCLVLGRGRTVWQEAEAALAQGEPAAVIVMGEAEQHWPGRIDAVASHDAHAREIARMMGFGEVRLCGALADAVPLPPVARYSDRPRRRPIRRTRAA